jgi:hypothetical protein
LNRNCARHGVHGTGKLNQHAIACRLYDATSMFGDGNVNKGFSKSLELGQRAFLVGTHKAAIAGDIRR